jgi:uncharacterized cysteine cluster protein YcgN (CxxCxxCC family)
MNKTPFWERKSLVNLNPQEWESLCDGCAQCCLYKIEDEETGDIFFTNVACRFLDLETCHCMDYDHRHEIMPTCVELTPAKIFDLYWLPKTCAYRLLAEDEKLAAWHPLISGSAESVHKAGISLRSRALSERDIDMDHLEDFIVEE